MRSRSPATASRCSRGLLSLGSRSDAGSYKPLATQEPAPFSPGTPPESPRRPPATSIVDSYFHHDEEERQPSAQASPCNGPEVLERWPVQGLTILMILSNSAIIGLETDLPELCHWDVVENAFLAGFTVELVLRIYLHGPRGYFAMHNNPDFVWNTFDLCIVATGIVNLFATALAGTKHGVGKNAAVFRIVRLLRILRVLRIIRIVRFLKQLYLLAYGFLEGIMAVFWVTFLASFMLYICSVILVRTYGRADAREGMDEEEAEFFEGHFGSIPRTMFSLFQLISAPDLAPYRTTMFKNPPLVVFLVTFIILGSFGINGLLVALINESILEKNQARLEADRMDRESKRKLMQRRCQELFDSLDVNKNRVLPRAEIIGCTAQLAKVFESLGVNFQRKDLDQMFYIMDYNDTGIIERSEFVQGVLELCDQIRPMSIMELHYQVSKCLNKVELADSKVEAVVKAAEQHDLRLDRLQCAMDSQCRPMQPRLTPRNRGVPRAANDGEASRGGLRRALTVLDGRCVDARARIEGLLLDLGPPPEGAEVDLADGLGGAGCPEGLQSLGECLLGLQSSNLEVLGAIMAAHGPGPGKVCAGDVAQGRQGCEAPPASSLQSSNLEALAAHGLGPREGAASDSALERQGSEQSGPHQAPPAPSATTAEALSGGLAGWPDGARAQPGGRGPGRGAPGPALVLAG